MRNFKEQVLKTITKYKLISPGKKMVAAVSGGPDSVAMLHVILELTKGWGVAVHVAHLNHMFRGAQSDEEADFVQQLAGSWGLPCALEKHDVPAYIRQTGYSPEEAARNVRYRFLRSLAQDIGANGILTAHHADDQAETVLLHLIRGSGLEGVAAISPKEEDLCRPLLEVTKEDILTYCRINKLEYRIDQSNQETDYMRNKIRLRLVPELKEYNPRVVQALARTADICRVENEFLDGLTGEYLKDLGFGEKKGIDFRKLSLLHPALQRRVVRRAFEAMIGKQEGLDYHHTERVLNLSTGKELCLPGGIYVRRNYDRLIFGLLPSDSRMTEVEPTELKLPGQVKIPEIGVAVQAEIGKWPDERFIRKKYIAAFNTDILKEPLLIRTRRRGDRFQPRGGKGTKKLKDFFIDEKIPRGERDRVPLLVSGEQIVWVIGHRLSQQFLLKDNDKKAVVIQVKNMDRA